MSSIKAVVLCLILSVATLSASGQTNETTSQMSSGLCSFKILIVGVLPTLSLLLFLITPFAIGFAILVLIAGYIMHKKQNAEGKVDYRNFKSLHMVLKIGLVGIVLAILLPIVAVACIILAVVAPILMNILVSTITGASVSSAC